MNGSIDGNILQIPMGICANCAKPFGECSCRRDQLTPQAIKSKQVVQDIAKEHKAKEQTELERLRSENDFLRITLGRVLTLNKLGGNQTLAVSIIEQALAACGSE